MVDFEKQRIKEARSALCSLEDVYKPLVDRGCQEAIELCGASKQRHFSSKEMADDQVLGIGAYWPYKELHRFFDCTWKEMDELMFKCHHEGVDFPKLWDLHVKIRGGAWAAQKQLDSGWLDCRVSICCVFWISDVMCSGIVDPMNNLG